MTPQWDTTLQASNFLPDEFDPAAAARLYVPVCIGAYPCSGSNRRGMDPRLVSQGVAPTPANTVTERFIGRLVPGLEPVQRRLPGRPGDHDELQDGSAFRISPRFGFAYDISRARGRRSSAAAPASSTTGRRATWCST